MFISFPEVHVPVQGLDRVRLPGLIKVRQKYDDAVIADPAAFIAEALEKEIPHEGVFSGKRIAVSVGSRGIPYLDDMVRSICNTLKRWGAEPFIVPAMGSHGGATAEGQSEILASYNITEKSIGVPVLSSMEVIQYGELKGMPLYCDKYAFEADGVVVFNKVKPHTDFRGEVESGLAKMIAIGLGKHAGATSFHSFGFPSFPELLPLAAEAFLETGKLAFGVGVVQNAYDHISDIAVCTRENFLETDKALQKIAKEKLAKFKFDHIDLLIVDEMGKNISGTGCDPNVIGRNLSNSFHGMLDLQKLFVRSLTPESHHSGVGLAMADMTTRACLNDVDWEASWANVLTTGSMGGGRIPMYANTDYEAILQCVGTCLNSDPANPRIVRIKNTLSLTEILVSPAIYADIKDDPDFELLEEEKPMVFDETGTLI